MADFIVCQFCGRTPFEYPGPPQPTCCEEMLEHWRKTNIPKSTMETIEELRHTLDLADEHIA